MTEIPIRRFLELERKVDELQESVLALAMSGPNRFQTERALNAEERAKFDKALARLLDKAGIPYSAGGF